jgi:hypothetical protein
VVYRIFFFSPRRLGIQDQTVLNANPALSLKKLRLQLGEGVVKVREGALFFVRGIRLLGSDTVTAGRLFLRVIIGEWLFGSS